MSEREDKTFTRCARCHTERLCKEYNDTWLCVNGPSKCWRKRRLSVTSKGAKR